MQSDASLPDPASGTRPLEEDVARIRAARDNALRTLSHEVRTPLNAILGMATLLLESPLPDRERDFAASIRSSGAQLLALVESVLDITALEAGEVRLDPHPFDLVECVEDVVETLAPEAAGKGISFACLIDPSAPQMVHGDLERVKQVLRHLLDNAVKFTAAGEVLLTVSTISDDSRRESIQFEVRDTGIGIAASRLGDIFEPFAIVDPSSHRRRGGAGLGLAITRSLVALMDGRIEVASAPGAGSVFTVELPLPAITPVSRASDHPALAGRRVRLDIDDPLHLRVLLATMRSWGMSVKPLTEDSDGGSADITVSAHPPQSTGGMLESGSARPSLQLLLPDGRERNFPLPVAASSLRAALLEWFSSPEHDALEPGTARDAHVTGADAMLAPPGPEAEASEHAQHARGASNDGDASDAAARPGTTSHGPDSAHPPARSGRGQDARTRGRDSVDEDGGDVPGARTIAADTGADVPLEHAETALARARILLAEDSVMNRKVALSLLARIGCRADVATNGVEALAALSRVEYDLVLMDVQMPEMDGLEATREIVRRHGLERPYIIAMTANTLASDRKACADAGMDDFVAKPIDVQQFRDALVRGVQTVSTRRSAQQSNRAHVTDIIDQTVLAQYVSAEDGDAPEMLRAVVGMYLMDIPLKLQSLADALDTRDLRGISYFAHSVQGSCAMLGALHLASLCRQFDDAAQQQAFAQAHATMERIRSEFTIVRDALAELGLTSRREAAL